MTRWDLKRELARKFVHILSILILLIYFIIGDLFSSKIALIILVLILIVSIEFEYLRIEIPLDIPILKHIWKYMRRKKEKCRLGGDVFFLIGAILVLAVFDLKIAIAAILMTTFGDMAAALIGKRFGKHWLKHLKQRAWEGILAEFFIDVLIGVIVFFWKFWYDFSIFNNPSIWIIIFVMAITATIVETIIYKMDDNLLIPVFAGFNGQIALMIVSYLF